jgi:dolichol-phosphate mannosyltransferase
MNNAAVIPCYKVKNKVLGVIAKIGPEIQKIYVVDDKCPELTGQFVVENCADPRVHVLYNEKNLGVGGAVIAGYKQALLDKISVIVKIDGDGQMDPALLPLFINPIYYGDADYTKGNRFYRVSDVRKMPTGRLIGNAILSFFNKISTGYWQTFDPTNGYCAISIPCLKNLDIDKLSHRYFFESDMLFRLSIIGATVKDIPMRAVYEDEISNLKIHQVLLPFLTGHFKNFLKRLFYDYILRNFSLASVSLVLGLILLMFGGIFGAAQWIKSISEYTYASSGTVMLAALPIIIGTQLILSFLNYDISKSRNNLHATFRLEE